MFLRLVICFFLVCVASCETEKKSEDPPLSEALNAKYFGHFRGKRTVSDSSVSESQNETYYCFHLSSNNLKTKRERNQQQQRDA